MDRLDAVRGLVEAAKRYREFYSLMSGSWNSAEQDEGEAVAVLDDALSTLTAPPTDEDVEALARELWGVSIYRPGAPHYDAEMVAVKASWEAVARFVLARLSGEGR